MECPFNASQLSIMPGASSLCARGFFELHYVAYAWRQICLRSYYRANPWFTMVTRVSGHCTDNDTLAVHKYGMSFQRFSTLDNIDFSVMKYIIL